MNEFSIKVEDTGEEITYQQYFCGLGYSASDEVFIRVFYEDKKSTEEYNRRFKEKTGRKPQNNTEKFNPMGATYNNRCKISDFESKLLPKLLTWNANGYGVFMVVNGGGQEKKDVIANTQPKAQFFEMDHCSLEEQRIIIESFPVECSALVQTKKSLHTYFYLKPGADWGKWVEVQKRLISKFDADKAIKDENRVMRIPGFYHNKDKEHPAMVKLLKWDPNSRYTQNDIAAELPALAIEPKKRYIPADQDNDNVKNTEKWLDEWLRKCNIETEKDIYHLQEDDETAIRYQLMNAHDIPWACNYETPFNPGDTILLIRESGKICVTGRHNHDKQTNGNMSKWDEFRSYHEAVNGISKAVSVAEKPKKTVKKLNVISAKKLQETELPPIRYIVENLIPQGETVIAAPPKSGKSWLMLQLCLSVARGEPFLGLKTDKCDTLYLALEDGDNFEQNRLNKQCPEDAPDNFHYVFSDVEKLGAGLLEQLEDILQELPEIGLIVIDTLAYVKYSQKKQETAYECDYRTGKELKAFADAHNLAVVVVTHTTKITHPEDPFANITGTMGVSGAADAMAVLVREKRFDTECTLAASGRRILQNEYRIKWLKDECKWQMIGVIDAGEDAEAKREYHEYMQSDIRAAVLMIAQTEGKWQGNVSHIRDKAAELGIYITAPLIEVGGFMKSKIPFFGKYDGVKVTIIKNGTASKLYAIDFINSGTQPKIQDFMGI